MNVASFYLETQKFTMDDFRETSKALAAADLDQTRANVGALGSLSAARYVISTLTLDTGDIADVYRALHNPSQYESLWLLAYAAQGDLFDRHGMRISSFSWDFEYDDNTGVFSLMREAVDA